MKLTEIEENTKEIFEVLSYCAAKNHRLCTQILIYSRIDIIASLSRPKDQVDTDGATFKAWVQKYLLPHLPPGLIPEDIWGARCGALHANQPDSKVSRLGSARSLQYIQAESGFIDHCQKEIDPDMQKVIFLDMRSLCEGFMQAVMQFFKDVNANAELRDRVSHHAAKVFSKSEYPIP